MKARALILVQTTVSLWPRQESPSRSISHVRTNRLFSVACRFVELRCFVSQVPKREGGVGKALNFNPGLRFMQPILMHRMEITSRIAYVTMKVSAGAFPGPGNAQFGTASSISAEKYG